MDAHVVNRNLNSRGGSARVCLEFLRVLKEEGYHTKVFTKVPLDASPLKQWNGGPLGIDDVSALEIFHPRQFIEYGKLITFLPVVKNAPRIFVNTSGDFYPFLFNPASINITYCHHPVVGRVNSRDIHPKYRHGLWVVYFALYSALLNWLISEAGTKALFLANSKFTKDDIFRDLGVQAHVIYPPVDVERFSSLSSFAGREDRIVTISRFNPSKELELIPEVVRALPASYKWDVVGSLDEENRDFYLLFREKIAELGFGTRVSLHPNAPAQELKQILGKAKVYFHPKRGEHFGISIVEAMAAGLVPVVWNYGGCSEVVPRQWQFSSAEEAGVTIVNAMEKSRDEGQNMRELSRKYSSERFRTEIRAILRNLR